MRKHSFSLLEVLIAFTLFGLLLSALLGSYHRFVEIQRTFALKQQRQERLSMAFARLQAVFSHVITRGHHDARKYTFYTTKEGDSQLRYITFTYYAGVDRNPRFGNLNIARLYLDKGRLVLARWPNPLQFGVDLQMRREVILDKVSSWNAEFFSVPHETWVGKDVKSHKNPGLEWVREWPAEWGGAPAIVRLSLQEEGSKEPLSFTFLIPQSVRSIPYTTR